jgi:predicted nucleic acid-binding protein
MTVERYARPYLDSSVYIAAIQNEENRVIATRQVLDAAEKKQIQIVASTFVVAEVIKMRGETVALSTDKESEIDEILMSDRILWVELDLSLAQNARKLARIHGLKPGDAIHLASAIRGKADVLFRYDNRFDAKDEIAGLELCEPFWFGDTSFPELLVEKPAS